MTIRLADETLGVFSPSSQTQTLVVGDDIPSPRPHVKQEAPESQNISSKLSPSNILAFGTTPQAETPDIVLCNSCSRPVAKAVILEHVERCTKKGDLEDEGLKDEGDDQDGVENNEDGITTTQ